MVQDERCDIFVKYWKDPARSVTLKIGQDFSLKMKYFF